MRSIEVVERGNVHEIRLIRPDILNRIDEAAHLELIAAFRGLATPEMAAVRAVVLSAEGPVFSAGGDLREVMRLQEDGVARTRMIAQARDLFAALMDVPFPIVAALNGDAIGLGATIVLACDAVVAWRGARLGDPHVRVGLVAGDGGCVTWPQAVGTLRAKRHLLTGDPIIADAAHAMGLVTDLADTPDDALRDARALAVRMAALPPLALQLTKRALNHVMRARANEVFDLALAFEEATLMSRDSREAADAMLGKRTPTYHGS